MAKAKKKDQPTENPNPLMIREQSEPSRVEPTEPDPFNLPAPTDPYVGMAAQAFEPQAVQKLLAPLDSNDIEIRPDGMLYLPEIKYRRVLNTTFGPGAWAIQGRGEWAMNDGTISREFALFINRRFVSEARGEQDYYPDNDNMSYATATEGAKSNGLMRCCKDLGIASELWDPGFIEAWRREHAVQVWRSKTGNNSNNKPQWRRKDREPFWDETGFVEDKQPRREDHQQQRQPEGKPQQEQSKPQDSTAKGPVWSEFHEKLSNELKAYIKTKPELSMDDFPEIIRRLTSWDAYDKTDEKGKVIRHVNGFEGVTDLSKATERMAQVALGKFRKALEQEQGKAKSAGKKK